MLQGIKTGDDWKRKTNLPAGPQPGPAIFCADGHRLFEGSFFPYRLSPALGRGNLSKQLFVQHGVVESDGLRAAANVPVSLPQNLDLAPEREVVFASEVLQKTELDQPLRPF